MFFRKQGFPEEGEIVLCRVTNVQYNSVFAIMTEYEIDGMIHISEISPGRIRNIRDFVKEDKIIVCKVLKVNKERKQVDLSLRRVTTIQRSNKINELKQEQIAEKIVEMTAHQLKIDFKKLYDEITKKVFLNYPMLFPFFEEVSKEEALIEKMGLEKKASESLVQYIKQRIKPVTVTIKGKFFLSSFEPDGIEIVRKILNKIQESGGEYLILRYAGAGNYNFIINCPNYKLAEQILDKCDISAHQMLNAKQTIFNLMRDEK